MVESVGLDADDRRVLHALQLGPRASFARIGAVLGMSERGVSRRYHRLRSQLILRVVGLTRHDRPDRADWIIQITPAPASVDTIARTLAARADTSWIASLADTGGLFCILRTTSADVDMLAQLRRMPHAGTVTAQRLLAPVAGIGGWPGRLQALTPQEQHALLEPRHPDLARSQPGLPHTADDQRLLTLLATDGRMSVARLARASGMAESTVRRRITELTAQGVLMFEVEIDPKLYGRSIDVICRLDVRPASLRTVATALGAHAEVAFAATTTGESSVLALLELTDAQALHTYLADSIGALPGVNRVHTEVVADWIKRAGPLPLSRR
ncbi:Lrp/AsnC family transcriptional regulator [Nocardia sp. NPDC060249]|uniref:Lrp/AsnC family transcriptional regulator n=1 Tax=Nocardia sp. NPDC060249 TaxID=3347082 RepID=UPI0036506E54